MGMNAPPPGSQTAYGQSTMNASSTQSGMFGSQQHQASQQQQQQLQQQQQFGQSALGQQFGQTGMNQQPFSGQNSMGQQQPFSGQNTNQSSFAMGGANSTRIQHKGVPQVIPTVGQQMPMNQQQQHQQHQQQQQQPNAAGPNLMQKLNEITAPGGDILSKGKELIFMKFGLGGK